MRAALDYIAYELARHHVGTMSDTEVAATAFPICKDKAAFDQFFTAGKKGSLRAKLYGDDERRALQCVQPFALTDEMRAVGVEPAVVTRSRTGKMTVRRSSLPRYPTDIPLLHSVAQGEAV